MKEQNLRVIRKEYDNTYIIIDANDVEELRVCDTYTNFGFPIDHWEAGDCSLMNSDCDFLRANMIKEGIALFGEDFGDIEYEDDNDVISATNLDELGLEDREEEINTFLNRYEEEHAEYETMTGINYWDGHNNMTEPINEEDYVDEELEAEILEAYRNAEFEKSSRAGYYTAECNGYSLEYHLYPTWYVACAEEE